MNKYTNNILIILILSFIFSCSNSVKENTFDNSTKIKVGVFNGNGASQICVLETKEALKIDTGIIIFEISSADIMNGKLDSIDVLIFPGGSGSKEYNNLGDFAVQKVHDFVKIQGKGIVGICAGGYILSTTPNYPSLKLIDAYNYDRDHYARGRGLIEFGLTEQGFEIFPELKDKKIFIQYYDGPILVPLDSSDIKFTEIAKYVTDIHSNSGIPSGVTPGKTFMLSQKVGKGQIFTIGGHPESTPGMRWLVPRMARYVHSQEIISYNDKWIRPEINDSVILFDSKLRKYEKENFWKLFSENLDEKIQAMNNLHKIRSRPAVRWNIGLLRDKNPKIRQNAAFLLMQTEYTWAILDLKQALKNEENTEAQKTFKESIEFLIKK